MTSLARRVVEVCLSAVAVVMIAAAAVAQDPAKVGPDVYKCTFENERTRVCEVTFKPGAKIGMHSHPPHLVYILSAGRLVITKADGSKTDLVGKPGDVSWLPAETHRAENVGATDVKALVVEFKEPDKLVRLTVDFGDHTRHIVAGIKAERANPAEIQGRQALFVVNLEPKRIRGQLSEGMLFDIGYADGIIPVLAVPEREVPNGARAG